MAGLSPLLREAFILHEQEGLTAPEIARILGISEAAAERRVGRAAEAFRRRYGNPSGEVAGDRKGKPWKRATERAARGRRTSRRGT